MAMLLVAAVAEVAVATATPSGCSLDATCLTGVASTIGYFENNPHAPKSMSCSEMWSEAVSSNCGPSSIHHRCPASAGANGTLAWLLPTWQRCAAGVIAAGEQLNITVCPPKPQFLQPHSLHSDEAVLQSGKPCFTGMGVPGDTVTVSVTKDGSSPTKETNDDTDEQVLSVATSSSPVAADGYWRVCLSQPIAPTLSNHTVRYSGAPSGSTAVNTGVLVGNVIVCSGQSNMEKEVGYAFNATAELAAAKALGDRIRTAGPVGPWNNNIDGGAAASPQFDTKLPMRWHAYGGSAICWMYGRRIQERYPTIPLGLIQAHVGGTAIEPWSPPAALATCGIKPAFHRAQAGVSCPPYCNTSSLFNGMIAPLLNYSIHHVIWYQGESNCGDAKYGCSQLAMVTEWRKQWASANTGNGNIDWPFGFVELAGYHRLPWNESQQVSQLRRQQQQAAALDNKTFYAVAMDLSDPAVATDLKGADPVHSRFKEQVGLRLSLGGRAVAFGEKDVKWRGPTAVSASLCTPPAPGVKAVCVKFSHVSAGGLLDFSHKFPDVGTLFELGYSDGKWRNATTGSGEQPSKDTISVTALEHASAGNGVVGVQEEEQALSITAVRYAQYNEPCDPSNDRPGMSPGGGGEHGEPPTMGNMTANLTCALYSRYHFPGGVASGVLLPARSFWLNVTR